MAGWVRVETRFTSHPKVLDIGPLGEALWLRGLCYAGDQLTDGFVPNSFLKRMGDMKAMTVAAKLVAAGLWEEAPDGFKIHDYLDWQRSRDEAGEISSKRAEAGRRGGQQKASNLLGTCLANGQQNPSNLGSKTLADKSREDTEEKQNESTPPESPKGPPKETRIPDDFALDKEMTAWAATKGFSAVEVDHHTERFASHWRGEGGVKAKKRDWRQAWQTWLLRETPGRWPGANVVPIGSGRNATPIDPVMERLRQLSGGEA